MTTPEPDDTTDEPDQVAFVYSELGEIDQEMLRLQRRAHEAQAKVAHLTEWYDLYVDDTTTATGFELVAHASTRLAHFRGQLTEAHATLNNAWSAIGHLGVNRILEHDPEAGEHP